MRFIGLMVAVMFLGGCSMNPVAYERKATTLKNGMTLAEVKSIMGDEHASDVHLPTKDMVLKYCKTGLTRDAMTYVWIQGGRVKQVLNRENRLNGPCSRFFQAVDWKVSISLDYMALKNLTPQQRQTRRSRPVVVAPSRSPSTAPAPVVIRPPDLDNSGSSTDSRAWQMLHGKGTTGSKAWDMLLD